MSLREEIKAKIEVLQSHLKELDHSEGKTYDIESAGSLLRRVHAKPHTPSYMTGIFWLDAHFGGFKDGSFINIAGESFSGKSTLIIELLANIAEYNKTVFFSFEMYENTTAKKLERLRDSQLTNLLIEQHRNELMEMVGLIRTYAQRGVKFFAIDSKMKVKVVGNMSTVEKTAQISSVLAKLCQELGVIIILINQIGEDDLKNGRMALKGSGDQVYDSDVIWFLTVNKDKDMNVTKRTLYCIKDRLNEKLFKVDIPQFNSKNVQVVEFKEDKIEMLHL